MVEIWGTQNERRTWNQWDTCNARLNVFALKHTLAKQHLITPFVCYRNIILICLKYIKTTTNNHKCLPDFAQKTLAPMILYIRYTMHSLQINHSHSHCHSHRVSVDGIGFIGQLLVAVPLCRPIEYWLNTEQIWIRQRKRAFLYNYIISHPPHNGYTKLHGIKLRMWQFCVSYIVDVAVFANAWW